MSSSAKVAIVTGGTSGIGAATALLLASDGAYVVVCGRDEERGTSFAREAGRKGYSISFERADCTMADDVERLFSFAESRWGGVDMLFANAGVEQVEPLETTSPDVWHDVIGNDLTSCYLVCRRAIAPLQACGGGAVVIMSSIVASVAYGFGAAFVAAQAAKEGMVRNLAAELGSHGIRVNGVAPGSIRTPSLLRFYESTGDIEAGERASARRHPLARIGSPEEVAEVVRFLLSDDASYVTGHILKVDGGLCAQ